MPKYRFICKKCNNSFEKIVAYDERSNIICEKCNNIVQCLPPLSQPVIVNDLVDPYRNKTIKKDINKIMKKRQVDHGIEHELGEMVNKMGLPAVKKTSYWKNRRKKIV